MTPIARWMPIFFLAALGCRGEAPDTSPPGEDTSCPPPPTAAELDDYVQRYCTWGETCLGPDYPYDQCYRTFYDDLEDPDIYIAPCQFAACPVEEILPCTESLPEGNLPYECTGLKGNSDPLRE